MTSRNNPDEMQLIAVTQPMKLDWYLRSHVGNLELYTVPSLLDHVIDYTFEMTKVIKLEDKTGHMF